MNKVSIVPLIGTSYRIFRHAGDGEYVIDNSMSDQFISGTGPNPYGHGKGLGKKIDRLTGTTKKSVQENRQIKRENKQIARQRRQANAPERREVRRPKSGLYKDTPKNKKPLGYRTYEDNW